MPETLHLFEAPAPAPARVSTPASSRPVADQRQRDAALDITESVLVQAPAGSGKTELLVMRYLALLAQVEQPESVLAITFTRLAAAEMRSRILSALEKARTGQTDLGLAGETPATGAGELPALAAAALRNADARGWELHRFPSRLNILTLDALSLRIAQSMPIGSRSGLEFQPAPRPGYMYSAAAGAALRALGEDGDPALQEALKTFLLHCDNNVRLAASLLSPLLQHRAFLLRYQHPSTEELDTQVRPQLEELLSRSITMGIQQAVSGCTGIPDIHERKLCELLRFAVGHATNPEVKAWKGNTLPRPETADLGLWRSIRHFLLTQNGELRKIAPNIEHGFPNGDPRKREFKQLCQDLAGVEGLAEMLGLLAALPDPHYTEEEWRVIRALFLVLRRATEELQKQFTQNGQVDFDEVTLAAVEGLRQKGVQLSPPPEHILIDEFQDTSLLQHELIGELIRNWRPGGRQTIFLVGDPMQSIYGFRQAEVLLFERVRRSGLQRITPVTHSLLVNFRSQKLLVEAFNSFFNTVFANGRKEIAFVSGEGHQPPLEESAVEWVKSIGSSNALANRENEAREVCDRLEPLWNARTPETKIAVLVRVANHAFFILEELRRRGIPYRAIGLESLEERSEIRDLLSLAAALLHPADRIAWLSVLRAPWCALSMRSLEAVVGLTKEERRSGACVLDLLATRAAGFPPDERARGERVLPILRAASAKANLLPLSQLLYATWRKLGGPSLVDSEGAANVSLFFSLVERQEESGEEINAEYLRAAVRCYKAEASPDSPEQLQVMTIHKAKGLGFDYVFIPGTQLVTRPDSPGLLPWVTPQQPDYGTALFLAPAAARGEGDTALVKWIKAERKQRSDAEQRRLLYVAMTRARKRVFLFATLRFRESRGQLLPECWKPGERCLLKSAWCAVSGEFEEFLAQQYPAHKAAWDEEQAAQAAAAEPGLAIAASAGNVVQMQPRTIVPGAPVNYLRRLPLQWQPGNFPPPLRPAREEAGYPLNAPAAATHVSYTAPASPETRAAGVVAHALLERLPQVLQSGMGTENWLAGVTKTARVLLLQEGISPARTAALAAQMQRWVENAAGTPQGRWVFEPKPGGAEELPITVSSETGASRELRLDRTFVAGETLLSTGNTTRWIVDYKTATPDGSRQQFLQQQAAIYADILRRYATAVSALYADGLPVRAALYFPAANLLHEVSLTMTASGS